MRPVSAVRATLLSIAISLALAGCSGDNDEMSQDEIQYLSHLDQSRFFQRQGELKASTLEARSAIEMQPERIEPYLIIINNLLTAGDARNAERQLDQLLADIGEESISQQSLNDAALIRAEARLMQQEYDEALAALEALEEPDRMHELEASLLRGDIHLAANRPEEAADAYAAARDTNSGAVRPLIGLAQVAFSQNDPEQGNEYIAQAEELDQDHVDLWLLKARTAHANEQWADAEQAYINALETIGQYDLMTFQKFRTMSDLIDVLRQQGKSSEAFVYEEILSKSAPGMLRSNMIAAQEAFDEGDLNNAARYLEEVLTQSPQNEQAAMMLGLIRFRQGRVEEAETLLAPVAALDESEQANRLLAATRLRMRDAEGAREILEQIDDKDSDPATLALVGIASLASGDIESGEQFIEKSLELNPDNNALRLRYADYHIQRGNADRAVALAREATDRDSGSASARQMLIRAQLAAGNPEAATETANNWLEAEPDSVQALMVRGNLEQQLENPERAAQFYEQASAAEPENAVPLIALGRLAQARDDTEQAQSLYTEALRLSPDNRQALQRLAAILPRDDMETLMEELHEIHPEAVGPRLILLESALINEDQARADELTASLTEREDEDTPAPAERLVANVYNGIATQLAQRGRTEQATEVLARARALFPAHEEIGLQAAALAFRQDDISEARNILSDVKQAHPESSSPFIVEARYFESQQEYAEASELYQLALEKDPDNTGLMMTLASLHQSNNKTEEAVVLYEKLVEMEPDNVAALNNLAWIYQENENPGALALAEKAYELSPESAAVADTYGWILLKNGEHAESLELLEKAHSLAPDSEEIARHLAEAYRANGRDAEAERLLEDSGNES